MEKISEMIEQLRSIEIEKVMLNTIATISIGEFVHKDRQNPKAPYPVYNGGSTYTGFYDRYNNTAHKILISARGATAGFVNRVDCNYWAGNSSYTIDVLSPNANWEYVYYYLKKYQPELIASQQKGGGVPAVSKKQIENLQIPLPPLPIQQEIVRVLDTFTQLQSNLEAELAARQKQYEYYRDNLFCEDVETLQKRTDCDIKTIGELGTITRGKRFVRTDIVEEGVPCIHYGDMYTFYGLKAEKAHTHITKEKAKSMRFAKKNDVVIVGAGENDWDIGVGLVWLGEEDAAIHDACYILNHEQNPMYISHFLRSTVYHLQLRKYVSSGKISSFSAKDLGRILIPISSLQRQQEIVSILDTFESLITNLKQEIEARKKQYEYYREQLLTF